MLIPAGYAQVNYRHQVAGWPFDAEVTLGLDLTGYAGPLSGVPQVCYDVYSEHVLANATSNSTLVEVSVKTGPNATGPTYVYSSSDTGQKGGESLEPAISILVKKTTAMGGRQGSGRWYLPAYAESDVGPGGILDNLFLSDFQDSLRSWQSDMEAVLLMPVLLRSETSPITTPEPIIDMVLQSRVATQRRRNRR